jgi:dTMP kinase
MFIVFEGIDGSGKTTQAELLCAYFKKNKLKFLLTKEPTKSVVGSMIRKKFLNSDTEPLVDSLLFAADSVLHEKSLITPALTKGLIVVSDRYFYSSLAYQSAAGVDINYLTRLHDYTLKPDIVFLLDCEPIEGLKRVKKRGIKGAKYEKLDFLMKVRTNYLNLVKSHKNIILIRSGAIDEVSERILSEVKRWQTSST